MIFMEHTNNRMQKYWPETREVIKKTWSKFTDVELGRINGNFDKFLEYLLEYYGGFPMTEAIARSKLNTFFNDMDQKYPERE